LNFRALEIRTIPAALAGAATALVLVLAGAGAWAIIGQVIVSAATSFMLLWTATPWRPRLLTLNWSAMRDFGCPRSCFGSAWSPFL
jgi:O-antigen/teichoic acid export membrane protein